MLLNFTGISAALLRRIGLPLAIALGMTLLAGGLALVARLPSGSPGVLLSGLLLMGTGCALANPAIIEAVMSAVPAAEAGTDAFARGLETGQLAGAAAVLLGGLLSAVPLHRAGRGARS